MDALSIQRTLSLIGEAAKVLGDDTSLRQLMVFLLIAKSGSAGVDGVTVETKLGASQAAVSRIFKLLGPELGLVEFFLDQNDGRRRLARLTAKGEVFAKALSKKS